MTSSPTDLLDRLQAPAAHPVRALALPVPSVVVLPGGARLHALRDPVQEAVQVVIVLPAGTWFEPAPATALLTARTLQEGTRSATAQQIAEKVAYHGAFLETQAGSDRTTLSLYCLSRHLPALLPLLTELLTEAAFPDAEVAAAKTRAAQQIQVEREKNAYRASERFTRNLFGPLHPYCTEVDVPRLLATTPDELRAFYQARYALGAGTEVYVAGGVTDELLRQLIEALPFVNTVAALPPTASALPVPGPAQDEIRLEKSLQSAIRVGRQWVGPHHPDVHGLAVLNKVLGGYFGSRLMKNIREDKGYTYGIYSSISHREHASTLSISAEVNGDSTEATFGEIAHEMRVLRTEPIPADELELVRNFTTGKFLSEASTLFDQLGKYRFLVQHGLPMDHYTRFLTTLAAITPEELLVLANQYLQPEAMLEVAVGRRG